MCADCDAFLLGQGKSAGHDLRVASVKTASHVCGADDVEDRLIVTHSIGAEAFTHVGVEVDTQILIAHCFALPRFHAYRYFSWTAFWS
ncbi:hypothetical protein D9M69_557060 [compost metagenome]